MRYPASEKLEIIRLVEQSQLPVKRTLAEARHRQGDLLPLVRPVSERRAGGPRRSLASAGSGLEPHPRRCPQADQEPGARRAGTLASGACRALHRYRKLLCVRSFGLPPAEGTRSARQPRLHRRQGGGRVLRVLDLLNLRWPRRAVSVQRGSEVATPALKTARRRSESRRLRAGPAPERGVRCPGRRKRRP